MPTDSPFCACVRKHNLMYSFRLPTRKKDGNFCMERDEKKFTIRLVFLIPLSSYITAFFRLTIHI